MAKGDMIIVFDKATGAEKYLMLHDGNHSFPPAPLPGEAHQFVPSAEVKDHEHLQTIISEWQKKQCQQRSS